MPDITTDASGNVYATGQTYSTDFPVQAYTPAMAGQYNQATKTGAAGTSDAYILKFSSTGVRLWATYYGGGTPNGLENPDDMGTGIDTDASGNVYIGGTTQSTNFPLYNPGGSEYYNGTASTGFGGARDMFFLKFNSSGVRRWATYYGGNGYNWSEAITVDALGCLYATG